MDNHHAVNCPSDPKATADFPASLSAVDAVSPTTATDLPTDVPTVDGASPSPTAGFPADGPAVVECLYGPL